MIRLKIALVDLFRKNTPFFELAKDSKRITHIAIAIPMILLVIIAGSAFGEKLLFDILLNKPVLSPAYKNLYTLSVTFSSVVLFIWLWIRLFEKRSLRSIGLGRKNSLKNYLQGFVTGGIMISIVIGIMAIGGYVKVEQGSTPISYDALGIAFLFLAGYIIQGASEEIIVRGWQFQVIGARYRPWIGAIISSLIFAFLHVDNNHVTILSIVNLFLFALFLVFLILKDHNIWAACGWHSAWNWTMGNIFGLNVSGGNPDGSFINLTSNGPDYFSGGDFGPEGSIFTSIILIMGILVILILKMKKLKNSWW